MGERMYGLEDLRSEQHRLSDRNSGVAGGPLDPLDPIGRCSELRPGSPPLPPSSLPHECQVCGKLISCRRNLWKHMERVHLTNPAVRCSICSKLFKNKYALKDHQRIYHGGLSEPLPPSPHHQQSQASLLRILRDARPSCPPSGPGGTPPTTLSPRPSCSISSVYPSSGNLDTRPPPPRDMSSSSHPLHLPSSPMETLPSYRRRPHHHSSQHKEEDGPSCSSGSSSALHSMPRYPMDRPPPPHLPPPLPPSSSSPSSMLGSRRDWPGGSSDPSLPMPPHHSIFPDLHNLPSKHD